MTGILRFPLRFMVFVVGLAAYWLEVGADWIIGARDKTEYVREGSCVRCGRCCCLLALVLPSGVSKHGRLVKMVGLWHRIAMNFHPVGEEDDWLIYRCGYYRDGDDGKPGHCSIYPFRHRLCRFFPRQRLYGHPSVHRDCGFRFVRRDVLERKNAMMRHGKPVFDAVLGEKLRGPI